MIRAFASGVATLLLLTACSPAPAASPDPGPDARPATTVLATTTTTLAATTSTPVATLPPEEVPDSALFLAAVDTGLAGTTYEGEAFTEPEIFLSTGLLFCDLLADGLTVEEVLRGYVAVLAAEHGDATIPEEELLLGGVVLGASIRVLCPEFEGQLEGTSEGVVDP